MYAVVLLTSSGAMEQCFYMQFVCLTHKDTSHPAFPALAKRDSEEILKKEEVKINFAIQLRKLKG